MLPHLGLPLWDGGRDYGHANGLPVVGYSKVLRMFKMACGVDDEPSEELVELLGGEIGVAEDRAERLGLQIATVNGYDRAAVGHWVTQHQVRSGLSVVNVPEAVKHRHDLSRRNLR